MQKILHRLCSIASSVKSADLALSSKVQQRGKQTNLSLRVCFREPSSRHNLSTSDSSSKVPGILHLGVCVHNTNSA